MEKNTFFPGLTARIPILEKIRKELHMKRSMSGITTVALALVLLASNLIATPLSSSAAARMKKCPVGITWNTTQDLVGEPVAITVSGALAKTIETRVRQWSFGGGGGYIDYADFLPAGSYNISVSCRGIAVDYQFTVSLSLYKTWWFPFRPDTRILINTGGPLQGVQN